MSKVYEALQHVFENQQGFEEIFPAETPRIPSLNFSTVPPLRMEREMAQLQQRLFRLLPEPHCQVIQFMSCQNDEGVSNITQEFARVVVEKQGKSVLLIDGDSRRMAQHHSLGVRPKMSLRQVMNARGDVGQALTPVIYPRLFVALYAGDSSEGHGGDGEADQKNMWNQIRQQFDVIVIDAPSIDSSDEGLKLCAVVDGVVMVVEAERTRSHVIANLKDQIVHNGGKLLGVVFNKQHHYIPQWLYKRL